MKDLVEFVVKIKDLASGGMNKLAATTQGAFRTMDNAIVRTQRNISRTRPSIDSLNRRLDDLRRTRDLSVNTSQIRAANREIERLERRIERTENLGRGRGGGLIGILGGMRGLAIGAGLAGVTAVGAGTAQSISAAAKQQQQLIGLKTFLGDKGANDAFANIKKDAAATPYGLDSLLEVNRALISAGVAAKDARRDTINLANAVAAVGGGDDVLSRMAANMQQIKTVGKATAMDIRQFAMAGINIYQVLADATGKSVKQVQEMEVSYNLLAYALDKAGKAGGIYAGALQAQSQTTLGRWNTFKDNIMLKAAEVGKSLEPITNRVLDMAIAFTDNMPNVIGSIQPLIDLVGQISFGEWFASIGAAVKTTVALIMPLLNDLKPVIVTVFQTSFALGKKIIAAIIPVFQRLAPILTDLAHIAGNILTPVLRVVGWALGKIVDIASAVISKIEWLIKPITKLLSVVSDGVGLMLDKVADVVDTKTPVIAQKIKNGINDNEVVSFFKKAGEMHGQSYVGALLKQYQQVAMFMDKFYKTSFFSQKFNDIATQLGGGNVLPEVVVKGRTKAPSVAPTSFDTSGTSKGITGGGARQIIINLNRAMIEGGVNITAQKVEQGVSDMGRIVREELLRILNSANAIG